MSLEPEKIDIDADKLPTRGIYLLPNLLTTAALFAGFYSIVAAMNHRFEVASLPFYFMIADGLDGRVARMTNTQTPLVRNMISLSDMAAFGIAPAILVYTWSTSNLGKLGWLAAFLYIAATALRLARFNTQKTDKDYFQGLSSTAAAGFMASMVWFISSYDIYVPTFSAPIAIITVIVGGLMVSTVRYSSFKSIDFKGSVPFVTVVLAVLLITAVALEPATMLMFTFTVYALSGPIMTLWQLRKMKKIKNNPTSGVKR